MIVSFRNDKTRDDLVGPPQPSYYQAISRPSALRKLRLLNNAKQLDDFHMPSGNRLEALRGR